MDWGLNDGWMSSRVGVLTLRLGSQVLVSVTTLPSSAHITDSLSDLIEDSDKALIINYFRDKL